MQSSEFCYLHNPAVDQQSKKDAQARGGKGNIHLRRVSVALEVPLPRLSKVQDVVDLLSETINELRTGQIDTKIANGIGYLSGHLVKAMELSELEERVGAIENALGKKIISSL